MLYIYIYEKFKVNLNDTLIYTLILYIIIYLFIELNRDLGTNTVEPNIY